MKDNRPDIKDVILAATSHLEHLGRQTMIECAPVHRGVICNETADKTAMQVAIRGAYMKSGLGKSES